ncbi:MAG: class I SAM-dependent methyltransferase [Candidatus Zixiibacteriota bacterium]|nr:MAG: class I SAM-dependent methyltransferase [candidate division Zixibacteria bacterium]
MRAGFFSEAVREEAYRAAGLEAGRLAVDAGAGSGFITEGLLQRGMRVIAVDPSPAMLEEMRRKFAGQTLDLRQGEAGNPPVEPDSADYVFANMVLHHVEDPPAAIAALAGLLKPGGRLVITDLDKHSFWFLRVEHHDRWMGFKREVVRRWFLEAGLQEVAVKNVGHNCCAASSCGSECASVGIWVAAGEK